MQDRKGVKGTEVKEGGKKSINTADPCVVIFCILPDIGTLEGFLAPHHVL